LCGERPTGVVPLSREYNFWIQVRTRHCQYSLARRRAWATRAARSVPAWSGCCGDIDSTHVGSGSRQPWTGGGRERFPRMLGTLLIYRRTSLGLLGSEGVSAPVGHLTRHRNLGKISAGRKMIVRTTRSPIATSVSQIEKESEESETNHRPSISQISSDCDCTSDSDLVLLSNL
jgi:hypothetical protein